MDAKIIPRDSRPIIVRGSRLRIATTLCPSTTSAPAIPDKIVLVNSIDDCRQELNDIFTQLKQANTAKIVARSASYMLINDDLLLACVDWDFIDEQGQVFADFCAYYHISILNGKKQSLAIVNVVSHERVNSLSLANAFSISG